ncbi:hypothetical protein F4779DRAFT_618460 [Xylariaceae sp. FL0662B]|nr:hypothetical protein F4779DRAFT_618460 [Xylariaceae sp. FL0662B]
MADEVERLAIAPFREIVEKGKVAIQNAPDASKELSPLMLKAAQNLVKEGERALKRIEPLCTRNYDEFGCNFIDAIKENDEIAHYRSELEDLLWDFDDYVEVDDFDSNKFEELQKASRRAAPKIMDILKRMKLVAPVPTPVHSSRAASASPDHINSSHYEQIPTSIAVDPTSSTATEKLMDEAELQLNNMMGALAGPDEGLEGFSESDRRTHSASDLDRSNSHRSKASEPTSESPPRPSSAEPWQVGKAPASPTKHLEEGDRWERPSRVVSDSPTIPPAQPVSPRSSFAAPLRMRRFDEGGPNWMQMDDDDARLRAASKSLGSASDGSRSPRRSHRWTNSTQGSAESTRRPPRIQRSHSGFTRASRSSSNGNESSSWPGQFQDPSTTQPLSDTSSVLGPPSSIPEDSVVDDHSPKILPSNITSFPLRQGSIASQNSNPRSKRYPSTESINSSVFDVVECCNGTSPTTSPPQESTSPRHSPRHRPPTYPGYPPIYQNSGIAPSRSSYSGTIKAPNRSSSTITARPGAETAQSPGFIDEGLIPVDMESPTPDEQLMPPREPDCTIGPFSSFYKLKGLCKGAEEAMAGQLGFRKIKRPVGGFSVAIVAKCNHCFFELDFKAVEQDLNNDSSANYISNNIGFRLRVLQKSHLHVRHVDEQMYGCLFCIQEGCTLEESDATVFFNQKQLFSHMARHPRPLPAVAGITVIEEPERPQEVKNNFDLHFPHPPVESVMTGISKEISRLPSAIATETRKTQNGVMRTPPDRTPVLQFAIGARIVGIEFPAKYEGKWGIGWHDGVRAAFESESVQIDAPPKTEIKMQGTSNVQAIARWKWHQKGDERWLKFDKGDVIKNIGWAYAEHWCWSGTTSKGWGIFPQSHMDPNTIRTAQPGDGSSVSSWEKKGPLRFSLRKNTEHKIKPINPFPPGDATVSPGRLGIY